MSENTKVYSEETLRGFVYELFCKAGMPEGDAEVFADTIITANLRGIDTHGVLRVPNYVDRLKCKAINPTPQMKVTQLAKAITLVDADDAAGCIGAKKAMDCAIENARQCGVGMAGVKNSNHFGAAAYYAQMAVDNDMIGIAITDVAALITAPGARKKLVGNNPIAVGIPTYGPNPFMLDMSLSVVAEGKIHLAAAKGEKIPFGWAVDKDGNPTDDPEEARGGFLLPISGFKGLGLAYVVDILSGLLTGGIFLDKIKSMYREPTEPGLTGHMMLAIDISAFLSNEEMKERMEYYREYLASAPMAEGSKPLCFPGEIEAGNAIKRKESGIEVPISVVEKLLLLKEEYEVEAEI